MNIKIEIIEHSKQRYPTVGDWFFQGDDLVIRVSKLSEWRREVLIAVHELIEVLICKHRGITQEQVDSFDKEYEKNRPLENFDEPGDDPRAPYHREHCLATAVERMLAAELDVNWKQYEDELMDELMSLP